MAVGLGPNLILPKTLWKLTLLQFSNHTRTIQKLVIGSRLARQDRLERQDFATRLANLEAKLDNRSVIIFPTPYMYLLNKITQDNLT